MVSMLWLVTVLVVVLASIPAVAHALELPGKMRLSKDEYVTMQRVYYPGFTIAGIAEPVAILLTLILLILAPADRKFWFILALAGLVMMQVIYWLVTHPAKKVWITGQRLSAATASFFAIGTSSAENQDWVALRNRWEYSHVARAGCAAAALIALLIHGS